MSNKEWLEKCYDRAHEKFQNFRADIKSCGGIITIDWKNEDGSSDWYVRYILDGTSLYITGDLGYAVFRRAEPYTLRYCKSMHKHPEYNAGKCRAVDPDTGIFCYPDRYVKAGLDEYFAEYIDEDSEEEYIEKIKDLKEALYDANNYHTGIRLDPVLDMTLSDINPDAWEYVCNIGEQYTPHYIAWLVGLKLAIQQYAFRFVDSFCDANCSKECSVEVWDCPKFRSYLENGPEADDASVRASRIGNLASEDRQIIYDALVCYMYQESDMGRSNHFAADTHAEIADKASQLAVRLREAWPDLLH